MPVTTAAIYARKSTDQSDRADEAKSVVRQVAHARAFADQKGWEVAEEYVFVDDGISGAEFARRPGFLRLMNMLRPRAPFQALIMSEESRLGRESIETAYSLKKLVTAGVRVFFYLENRERTIDSPIDKVMLSLTAFADELERERARQRTYDALLRKAQSGLVTGGRVFGYTNLREAAGVRREINRQEAAVVERIFALAAQGSGFATIAKTLNQEGALCPRSQQGRPAGWAPSSVREVLYRPLYRGEIVWNRTRKRDSWGVIHQAPKAEADWIRIPAPDLAIVPDALWHAAHQQMAAQRVRYSGRSAHGAPPWSRTRKYLLTGLLRCSICGAGMEARSGTHGKSRRVFYGCSAYHRRGTTVCTNRLRARMEGVDSAVLTSLEEHLLNPAVLESAVQRAVGRLTASSNDDGTVAEELRRVNEELSRLTEAVAKGGDLPVVLTALREREARRQTLLSRRATRDRTPVPSADAIIADLQSRIADWRLLFHDHPGQARTVVKQLIVGRLDMTPHRDEGYYSFTGTGTIEPLLAGVVPHSVASPRGLVPGLAMPRIRALHGVPEVGHDAWSTGPTRAFIAPDVVFGRRVRTGVPPVCAL
jgi:site-specific DNA recombinase